MNKDCSDLGTRESRTKQNNQKVQYNCVVLCCVNCVVAVLVIWALSNIQQIPNNTESVYFLVILLRIKS